VKIVIYGLAKSGTSALFYKIRNSLPAGTIAQFEPSRYTLRDRLMGHARALRRRNVSPDVLAKVLPWENPPARIEDFERFDRQILIVRDPRDRLVSALLYLTYNAQFVRSEAEALEWLRLLRLKEAEPASVPVVRLLEAFDALELAAGGRSDWVELYQERGVARPLRFHAERPHLHLFRYEQLIEDRVEDLETFLGLRLTGTALLPPPLRRVERTKGSGSWRSWFTPEDVQAFEPVFRPYLDLYYPGSDWNLGPPRRLDPELGSLYVERIVNEKRALAGLAPLPSAR
jgi:hypothetical protein